MWNLYCTVQRAIDSLRVSVRTYVHVHVHGTRVQIGNRCTQRVSWWTDQRVRLGLAVPLETDAHPLRIYVRVGLGWAERGSSLSSFPYYKTTPHCMCCCWILQILVFVILSQNVIHTNIITVHVATLLLYLLIQSRSTRTWQAHVLFYIFMYVCTCIHVLV